MAARRAPSREVGEALLLDNEPVEGISRWAQLRNMARTYLNGKNAALTIGLAMLVGARTCDQVLYYRLNYSYRYFVWYFASVILACPFSFIVVAYKMMFTKDITPEMRQFPQRRFALMGLLDTLFNIFSTFPVQHLGGDLSNALNQSILPINMIGSFLFLKTRFTKAHYVGAMLVVYGILVKLSPSIGTPDFAGSFGWIMLVFASQIPSAGSNIYKELGLKADDLDVWYANAWISTWQLLWGALSFWTIFIPIFVEPYPGVDFGNFWTYIKQANACFIGETVSITSNSTAFIQDCISSGSRYDYPSTSCIVNCNADGSPLEVFCVYIIFNITYNTLTLYIFKHGSSVLYVVANAVRLPLVDALNSVAFISGQAQESFGKYDAFALFILMLAIFIYYSEPEVSADKSRQASTESAHATLVTPRVGSGNVHSRVLSSHYDGEHAHAHGHAHYQSVGTHDA